MKQLAGKNVLVTGSTSGIGLAIAKELANENANLVLHGLADEAEWQQVCAQFDDTTQLYCDSTDISSADNISAMCQRLHRDFGQIDILVNNAGIQRINPTNQFKDDDWHQVIAINLSAAFFLSKHLLPHMQQQGWGRIINIASVHGLVASVNKPAYVSAKHGLVGLTKSMALENATQGITINAVCPGWVETDLIKKQYEMIAQKKQISVELAKKQLICAKQPTEKFIQPDAIGKMVGFLCSQAAEQITGSAYNIDGGWLAQ